MTGTAAPALGPRVAGRAQLRQFATAPAGPHVIDAGRDPNCLRCAHLRRHVTIRRGWSTWRDPVELQLSDRCAMAGSPGALDPVHWSLSSDLAADLAELPLGRPVEPR